MGKSHHIESSDAFLGFNEADIKIAYQKNNKCHVLCRESEDVDYSSIRSKIF